MLALSRRLPDSVRYQDKRSWTRWPPRLVDSKTVGIYGVGLIAEALAPRCAALDMTVIGFTSTKRELPGFDRVANIVLAEPPSGPAVEIAGSQVRYTDAGEECFLVHDGDVSVIKSGYHPVVAAPGYELYYLWVMAGEGRQPIAYFDPAHTWVEGRP
jgi:hypothetical protein